jgi:hypothetical protein
MKALYDTGCTSRSNLLHYRKCIVNVQPDEVCSRVEPAINVAEREQRKDKDDGCEALARALWIHRQCCRGSIAPRRMYATRRSRHGDTDSSSNRSRECDDRADSDTYRLSDRADHCTEHFGGTSCDGNRCCTGSDGNGGSPSR